MLVDEFIRLVKATRLRLYSIRFAYRALVLGEKNANIAKIYNVKRQVVEQAKRRVLRQKEMENSVPETWQHISTHLPYELVEAVKWLEEQAKHKGGLIVKRSKNPPELSAETIELISHLLCKKSPKVQKIEV